MNNIMKFFHSLYNKVYVKTCPSAFLQKRENFSFMKQAFILLNISI